MSGLPPLLVIALVLIAGCMSPAPKDTPATAPVTGSVEVSSAPPGAEVYLDTIYRGTTPVTVIGEPGSHTLELRLHDYQSWSESIVIDGGARGSVYTELVPVPVVTTPPATLPATSPATLPTTRPRFTTSPTTMQTTVPTTTTTTTTTPGPTATTPGPRTIPGCFLHESSGQTGTGENFDLNQVFWFQPAGVGLINSTWIYAPPKKPEITLTGFTWSRDPVTERVSLTLVGGGPPGEVYYNADNDTITFSNSNMLPAVYPRVPC